MLSVQEFPRYPTVVYGAVLSIPQGQANASSVIAMESLQTCGYGLAITMLETYFFSGISVILCILNEGKCTDRLT